MTSTLGNLAAQRHTGLVPRRNRVDPWGDLHAVEARGLFTGNRGCLVDEERQLVRHHNSNLWITCVTRYRDWRSPLDAPHHWTPLFFLDDAVALAAGHRPCGLCRRDDYQAYQAAVARADANAASNRSGTGPSRTRSSASSTSARGLPSAQELNRRLAAERLDRGRGLDRGRNRRLWSADLAELPPGTVVVGDAGPLLVSAERLQPFSFAGWGQPQTRPATGPAVVLTPPTSVAALTHGFEPRLHPTAAGRAGAS